MMIADLNHAQSVVQAGDLARRFRQAYGTTPSIFRAPGRVNLIGEHTDYNGGFVMPAAIGMYTWVAVAPRNDHILRITSEQFGSTVELTLDRLAGPPQKHWSDYVRGVAAVLQETVARLKGAELLIASDVPLGAGLSSSAALEVSTALALAHVAGVELPLREIALICQRAENEYSGTRCGIMDQFVSCFGHSDSALLLDCRSLDYRRLPIPQDVRLVICNTMVKHELNGGEYNERRRACGEGVNSLREWMPNIRELRDVSRHELQRHGSAIDTTVYRRCKHVVTENERVLQSADALESGNLTQFGQLMYQSHLSLKEDYEVSCEELDVMVELTRGIEGVYGARMTGGGFGGCTVNLVRADAVQEFEQHIRSGYGKATGRTPAVYVCCAAQGAARIAYGDSELSAGKQ
jgi:galactokinase